MSDGRYINSTFASLSWLHAVPSKSLSKKNPQTSLVMFSVLGYGATSHTSYLLMKVKRVAQESRVVDQVEA